MISKETISFIEKKPAYGVLLELSESDPELVNAIIDYAQSDEYREAINLISKYSPYAKNLLEIGALNELSGINLAVHGYNVTVIKPIKLFAARSIAEIEKVKLDGKLTVAIDSAPLSFTESDTFDIIYVRQRMHHAEDLGSFINSCVKQLKPDGVIISMRDDVLFDGDAATGQVSKTPLRKDVTIKNDFSSDQYKQAMLGAGLHVLEEMKFFDLNDRGAVFSTSAASGTSPSLLARLRSNKFTYPVFSLIQKFINLLRGKKSKKPTKVYSYVSGRQIHSVLILLGVKTINLIKNIIYHD